MLALKSHLFISGNGESEVQETRFWCRKKKEKQSPGKQKLKEEKKTSGEISSENQPTGNRNQNMEDLCDQRSRSSPLIFFPKYAETLLLSSGGWWLEVGRSKILCVPTLIGIITRTSSYLLTFLKKVFSRYLAIL